MTPLALAALTLLAPTTLADHTTGPAPSESSLLILLMGEPDFDFDLVEGVGAEDPVTPSTIGADGMRILACEEFVAGMEHWTAFDSIACTDGYSMEELKRLLAGSDPEGVPQEIADADYLLLVHDLEVRLRMFRVGTPPDDSIHERLRVACRHMFWDKSARAAVDEGVHALSRYGRPPNTIQRWLGVVWVRLDWRDAMDPLARSITRGSPFRERQKAEVDERYRGLD
jgi:hypothetical protein